MSRLIEERFWENVNQKTTECWNWKGNINSNGYGRISINKQHTFAHRASWIIHNGEIPKDMHICHHCDNRRCVNPNHLFMGTNQDNVRDKVDKRRQSKGVERPASKLTPKLVREIRHLFIDCGYSNKQLSEMYQVSPSQISCVVHRKSWKHVT